MSDATETNFSEAILGKPFLDQDIVKRLLKLPLEWRATGFITLFATLLYLPYLGAVGLWDPWETHYGEVAREMIQRNDWVHPYWENMWFFSKPAFTMWMQAFGMETLGTGIAYPGAPGATWPLVFAALLVGGGLFWRTRFKSDFAPHAMIGAGAVILGAKLLATIGDAVTATHAPPDALGTYTEWGFRLPFFLFSVLACSMLTWALARTVNARVALATGFVLATMPLYFLLTRQAVTDNPLVNAMICTVSCAIVGLFDKKTERRSMWWYGFYVFSGFGLLAKELLALIPGVVLLIYAILSVMDWSAKGLEQHARWFFKRAAMPVFVGLGAGMFVWAATYVVWDNRFYGLTPLMFAVFGVPAFFLGRQHTKTPWNNRLLFMIGSGLAVAAGAISAIEQVRNLSIAVALPTVGAVLLAIADSLKGGDDDEVPVLFRKFYEMRFGTGVVLFLAVAAPWYARMFAFESVDDEGKLFWYRVLIHDQLARIGSGVHTTTPGGEFVYFIQQGGYAIYPWVVLVPGAIVVLFTLKLRSKDSADGVGTLAAIWLVLTVVVIGSSATKFHHYVFPMLPPMAMLIGFFIDKLWKDGIARQGLALIAGVPFFVLVGKDLAENPKDFTDLFVYNYDRPYPQHLVTQPIGFWSDRPLGTGDLIVFALIAIGGYLVFETFGSKRSVFLKALSLALGGLGVGLLISMATRGQTSPMLLGGLGLLTAPAYCAYEAMRPTNESRAWAWLLTLLLGVVGLGLAGAGAGIMMQKQPDPMWQLLADPVNVKEMMAVGFIVFGLLCAGIALARAKVALYATAIAGACVWAFWFNWSHWTELSHHWTQRDQFWEYYRGRQPGEPITAFLMNWRGETFYSRNTVKQIKDNGLLYQYAQQPGREWALVEHPRLGILKSAVGSDKQVTLIKKDLNVKFVLTTIE
ncbi:MAG: glycosyltransferase family 39 protein [Myxococcaceae bacterium]